MTDANYSDLDAEENFDYAVPARVLHDFLELTPTNISSSQFCDLRFYEYLRKLICTDAGALAPMFPCPWLLAQYKVPQAEKMRFFDAGGVRVTGRPLAVAPFSGNIDYRIVLEPS